jgi:O-antigen/teichoic acid export membrane protein
VFAGSAAIVFILFGETFLRLWTQNAHLASRTAPVLSLLILGNLLNGLMWVPYQAQLAYGWTSLGVRVNLVSVAVIVPAILLVTPRYGAIGAAWVWVSLNMGYVLFAAQFMYRRILKREKWRWFILDLLAPLGSGLSVALLLKLSWPASNTLISQLLLLGGASLLTSNAALLAAGRIRQQLRQSIQPQCSRCRAWLP